jgi:hypothetical protein
MGISLGSMSLGDILDRGIKLFFGRLGTFFLISFICLGPLLIVGFVLPPRDPLSTLIQAPVTLLLSLILRPINTAAILFVICQEYLGQKVDASDSLRFAFGRFGRLLGASILAGLIIMVGAMLCLVPGLIFAVWYVFVGQVVVMENLGGDKALRRSKELTADHRWRAFGLLMLLVVVQIIVGAAFGALNFVLPTHEFVPTDTGVSAVLNYRNYCIQQGFVWFIQVFVESYSAICFTLLYFDVRNRKEGFDLQLAAMPTAEAADS